MSASDEKNDATAKPAQQPEKVMVHQVYSPVLGEAYRLFRVRSTTPGEPDRFDIELLGEVLHSRPDTWAPTFAQLSGINNGGRPEAHPIGKAMADVTDGLAVAAELKVLVERLDGLKIDLFEAGRSFHLKAFWDFIRLLKSQVDDAARRVEIKRRREAEEEEERISRAAREKYLKEKQAAIAAEEARKEREAEEYEARRPPAIC
jgi:hypothetical protein